MASTSRTSLDLYVQSLRRDHGRNVFVVMRFANNLLLETLFKIIKEEAAAIGVRALRADDKEYARELWTNVEVYMVGADAAIVIFDGIQTRGQTPTGFNPNVSIEAGYMLGLDKPVLLLKDKYLDVLPTDFQGMLYSAFDPDQPESARAQVRRWLESVFSREAIS